MIIYPAIDIRGGRVVRLLHGDPSLESVYDEHPLIAAQRWQVAGSEWVHVVSLDGTLGEGQTALQSLREIATTGLKIQYGGGIRSLEAVEQALEAGATRVVLGTLLVQSPELAPEALTRFGAEALTVALDVKNEKVATHGWQSTSAWTPITLGQKFAEIGLRHALYTDVSRDGDFSGVNVQATADLAQATGLSVIASGGVANLDDIIALRDDGNIAGVVIGRALYAKAFTLETALHLVTAS